MARTIRIEYVCNCSKCKDDVEMENLDEKEKEKQHQKNVQESLNLQKLIDTDELSTEAIQHHSAQIAYECRGTHDRAAMIKIIENPNDLTRLKEYLDSIGISPQEKFSHDLLMKIKMLQGSLMKYDTLFGIFGVIYICQVKILLRYSQTMNISNFPCKS